MLLISDILIYKCVQIYQKLRIKYLYLIIGLDKIHIIWEKLWL